MSYLKQTRRARGMALLVTANNIPLPKFPSW